jgi:hypothetical protein
MGSGVWVVEVACKYDGCGDHENYVYDNEGAARSHADILNSVEADSNLKAYCYEAALPEVKYHRIPPLGKDGRPI